MGNNWQPELTSKAVRFDHLDIRPATHMTDVTRYHSYPFATKRYHHRPVMLLLLAWHTIFKRRTK